MNQPNCYTCRYRREVPGSAHSACDCPLVRDVGPLMVLASVAWSEHGYNRVLLQAGYPGAVTMHPTGIRGGWAAWPVNFNPTWVETCIFYEDKSDSNEIE